MSANYSQRLALKNLPSEEREAPDSLNRSDPIWIGKTLPAGSMFAPCGDSTTCLGLETSMTLPCGPVPLLCSFRRSIWIFSCDVDRGAESLRVTSAGRASVEGAMMGEVMDASDDCRDWFWRFEGFSVDAPALCDTAELGSESTFLFIPVWTTGLCCIGRGGGGSGN